MHEVSIVQKALEIALEQAQGATKIHALKLRVGELSGVVPEALEFAFEVVVQGTIASEARLEIDRIPVVCHCSTCNLDFQPANLFYECPQCHQISIDIVCGRELEIASLEVS
ncbi:MAG: hydrogenase maturation nickel metallochaperone HypA [Cyanosarcina radialis HA8281-LM2]|nr:hydrogenase maturation nickel metallochaperone HypA [Cyanosarcina radialis HA8281-LM2]